MMASRRTHLEISLFRQTALSIGVEQTDHAQIRPLSNPAALSRFSMRLRA
jgi:hypothetical protein